MKKISSPNHWMLADLSPGELILSGWALRSLAKKATEMGNPIAIGQARQWISKADDSEKNWGRDTREDWTDWLLDNIEDLQR